MSDNRERIHQQEKLIKKMEEAAKVLGDLASIVHEIGILGIGMALHGTIRVTEGVCEILRPLTIQEKEYLERLKK